jgi:hypothetical protein
MKDGIHGVFFVKQDDFGIYGLEKEVPEPITIDQTDQGGGGRPAQFCFGSGRTGPEKFV